MLKIHCECPGLSLRFRRSGVSFVNVPRNGPSSHPSDTLSPSPEFSLTHTHTHTPPPPNLFFIRNPEIFVFSPLNPRRNRRVFSGGGKGLCVLPTRKPRQRDRPGCVSGPREDGWSTVRTGASLDLFPFQRSGTPLVSGPVPAILADSPISRPVFPSEVHRRCSLLSSQPVGGSTSTLLLDFFTPPAPRRSFYYQRSRRHSVSVNGTRVVTRRFTIPN